MLSSVIRRKKESSQEQKKSIYVIGITVSQFFLEVVFQNSHPTVKECHRSLLGFLTILRSQDIQDQTTNCISL